MTAGAATRHKHGGGTYQMPPQSLSGSLSPAPKTHARDPKEVHFPYGLTISGLSTARQGAGKRAVSGKSVPLFSSGRKRRNPPQISLAPPLAPSGGGGREGAWGGTGRQVKRRLEGNVSDCWGASAARARGGPQRTTEDGHTRRTGGTGPGVSASGRAAP